MKIITAFFLSFFLVLGGCTVQDSVTNGKSHPPEYKSDEETWDTDGGRSVILMGCKEWREIDPEADC